MTPEGKVKAKLKIWLHSKGAYYFMPVQTGYGATSLDFIVCDKGRFIAYETKAAGGVLTPRQRLVARQIKAAGGTVWLVTLDDRGDLCFNVAGLDP